MNIKIERTPVEMALESIENIGSYQCRAWRVSFFSRHSAIAEMMAAKYKTVTKKSGYVEANKWLSNFDQSLKLGGTGLSVDCGDDDIKNYADVKSRNLNREFLSFAQRCGARAGVEFAKAEVEKAGFVFPLVLKGDESPEERENKAVAAIARVIGAKWWRNQLRTAAKRQMEHINRCGGLVSRQAGAYVSNFTLNRRKQQRSRNNQLLLGLEAENEYGYKKNLHELAMTGQANPVNKRNELMMRMSGFEEIAKTMGFVGVFYTITCPSKYHAVKASGEANKKYDGSTPKDAGDYLGGVWSRIRAEWSRKKIRPFGFRIAEPHHDGTPHWHMLLFMPKDQEKQASEVMERHSLVVDCDELGAGKYRFDKTLIDWKKGSATGYVAKYVAKNIDGFKVDDGDNGGDWEAGDWAANTAARVDAWAACWGLRQFQQIGAVSVTVWRELRRRRETMDCVTEKELEPIREAANAGDWVLFVELMGGVEVARKDMIVRPDYEESQSEYGEVIKKIQGVVMRGIVRALTRLHTWTVRPIEECLVEKGISEKERAPPDF